MNRLKVNFFCHYIFLILGILALFLVFGPIERVHADTCTVNYSLSPASPMPENSSVKATMSTISSPNLGCFQFFKDGSPTGACQIVGSNVECTFNSGTAGDHILQFKYGQSQYYPGGTNCGSGPVDCNTTPYKATSAVVLPAPTNLKYTCDPSGNKVTFSWNAVVGAGSYTVRVNKEPYDIWQPETDPKWAGSGSGDFGLAATSTSVSSTASSPTAIVSGANYGWSVQPVRPNETYPFSGLRGEGEIFNCAPAPTPIPTFNISGVAVDSFTVNNVAQQKPLAGVQVSILTTSLMNAVTDSQGRYSFANVISGERYSLSPFLYVPNYFGPKEKDNYLSQVAGGNPSCGANCNFTYDRKCDFNDNGVNGDEDFDSWLRAFTQLDPNNPRADCAGAANIKGQIDKDGKVDLVDFNMWRNYRYNLASD